MDVLRKQQQIQFDFEQAMNRAKELDALAEEIDRAGSGISGALQPLRSRWNGESADALQGKGAKLQDGMRASAKDLRCMAEEVRRVAKRVRAMEMANLQLVMERGG